MKALLLSILLLFVGAVNAEPHFEFAGGKTYFQQEKKDNYWYQEMFPSRHDHDATSWRLAYVQPWAGKWSYSVGWVNLGSNSVHGFGVPDDDYNDATNTCTKCDKVSQLNTVSTGYGPEVGAVYDFSENVYLRTGLFVWVTTLESKINRVVGPKWETTYREQGFLLAPYLGVGVNYGRLFAEVNYYYGLGGGGYPLAKQAVAPMLGFRHSF